MNSKIEINRFLAATSDDKKAFDAQFTGGINIIYGRNTSGKSTVLQAILYTLGINDVKDKLGEILAFNPVFRLDITLSHDGVSTPNVFIRENNCIYHKQDSGPFQKFSGIDSDNSIEHIKYKEYFHSLFKSTFTLNSKGEYKIAPIEALLLPFYVSQDVGWVYLRRSFSSMDFYKNFKEDYLDHFLGVENDIDKQRRLFVEKEMERIQSEIAELGRIQETTPEIVLSKIDDEEAPSIVSEYVSDFSNEHKEIVNLERKIVILCNELSLLNERKKVISIVKKNNDSVEQYCPTCHQVIISSLTKFYQRTQDMNDTKLQIDTAKTRIREIQSEINKVERRIEVLRVKTSERFAILQSRNMGTVSVANWISMKAHIQIDKNLEERKALLSKSYVNLKDELDDLKADTDVENDRVKRAGDFKRVFKESLSNLKLSSLSENRFSDIYSISIFPFQGVELLKTVMAYHFSFASIVNSSSGVVVFPLMLDAIFKEDIEEINRKVILEFIGIMYLHYGQMIITIAHSKNAKFSLEEINKINFNNTAKLINIGSSEDERAFFSSIRKETLGFLEETRDIINEN